MFIKYSKKLNPKKPNLFKKDLNINKKLRELSEKIHSLKFVDINACLICASKLGQLFVSRNYIWMQCKKCQHMQKRACLSIQNY